MKFEGLRVVAVASWLRVSDDEDDDWEDCEETFETEENDEDSDETLDCERLDCDEN